MYSCKRGSGCYWCRSLNDGTTNAIYGLARIKSSDDTWYQHDGLGSVRAVLDGAGAVQSTTSYDPWGVPVPPVVPPGVGGGSTAPFGFTSERQDGDLVPLETSLMMTAYPIPHGLVLSVVCDSVLFAARTYSAPKRLSTLKVTTTA
ncbi:MAG: hypothetical protein GFH27_549311n182 [Chloroflexi bacterium AL-W]|nr:hypothetical protein [Chloroflexi bacterium AL-N1]NOK68640.1 hypothetical protein [Chloroflexi bacterium AL-N10]NOK76126.1 hypothetical protein [Chloroflexi bacterium AL-N5]NOK84237.1 hypothetical protein [Chloroflexi bacterium AL-W]NOK91264.1 hypothetical protein [Chloroflexi bacterium AL-N15]